MLCIFVKRLRGLFVLFFFPLIVRVALVTKAVLAFVIVFVET